MDWKNISVSPEIIVDIVVYLVVAVLLIIISKWLWEDRQWLRLKKERQQALDYQQQDEDAGDRSSGA